jgi:hypothetical protein
MFARGTVHWIGSERPRRLPWRLDEDGGNRKALVAVIDSIATNVPLVFVGPTGTGKSTLMAEVDFWTGLRTERPRLTTSRIWLDEPNWWTSAADYCTDVQRGYGYQRDFPDWGDWYSADGIAASVRRLFLDDLGVERNSEDAARIIALLVERRYAVDLPTWVTTNLTPLEIAERYGERTSSRLLGANAIVKLSGRDRRAALAGAST